MKRYTFGETLPVGGASSSLITAAVECTYPTTLTNLAREGGISKFAASRAAPSLIASGLLLNSPDGYEFNEGHPMAKTIMELAWRLSGVRRERPSRFDFVDFSTGEDYHYQRTVPKTLQRGESTARALTGLTGPDLVTVRDTCDWLAAQTPGLCSFENDGQQVYSLWSNERLRDLIHQTLHLGGAVGAAWTTLAEAAGQPVQGDGNPFEIGVDAHAWVRATYLLSAEVRDVLRVIGLLDQAIWVGGHVNRLNRDALDALNTINYAGRDSDFFKQHLSNALNAKREASELWSSDANGPWHNFGGTPRPEDVGTAGDQIMATRLLRVAQNLAAKVEIMSTDPSIQTWADDNTAEAAALPLITKIDENSLRGHRDWPKTPPRGTHEG